MQNCCMSSVYLVSWFVLLFICLFSIFFFVPCLPALFYFVFAIFFQSFFHSIVFCRHFFLVPTQLFSILGRCRHFRTDFSISCKCELLDTFRMSSCFFSTRCTSVSFFFLPRRQCNSSCILCELYICYPFANNFSSLPFEQIWDMIIRLHIVLVIFSTCSMI